MRKLKNTTNIHPIDWDKLINHIESGKGNKEQIKLLLAVIVKAIKQKQELSGEFIDYLSRVSHRYAADDISLDQALLSDRKLGRKSNQPAELGGMTNSIGNVYREMLNGVGKDSAINSVAAKIYTSPSKLRDDIKFYKQDFLDGLLLEKELLKTKFIPNEIKAIKVLLDPNFTTENV